MLQSLLEERFGLKVHRNTQTKEGFALLVGKNGPKLKPAEPTPAETQDLTLEQRQAQLKEQAQAGLAAMMKRMQETAKAVHPCQGSAVRPGLPSPVKSWLRDWFDSPKPL